MENVPAGHVRHAFAEVAFTASLYVPAPHCVQLTLPGANQEPAAQHTAAPGALPLLASHGAQEDDEVAAGNRLKRPAAQGWHADGSQRPMAALKVPAGQGVGVEVYMVQ